MKLEVENKQNVLVSAENTQKISISLNENDQAILIDLQINKLYQNKIRAVVQEYMSNARDANVDAGKQNEPIYVQVPTHDNPVFYVRDVGIGMSPEIIKNYICVVGASTKRDTNQSLGCFGYGSKCGYAYVNENGQQFSLTTVYDGIKYCYLLYYDEKHFPNVSLLSKNETDEPSGTIVEIPVASYDVDKFKQEINNILKHWIGVYNFEIVNKNIVGEIKPDERRVVITSDNYEVFEKVYWRRNNTVEVVVGGIPYEYSVDSSLSRYFGIEVRFPIGSLQITPSREQLEITKNNTDKILEVVKRAEAEVKKMYEEKLSSCQTELDVFKKFYKANHQITYIETLEFNGNPILISSGNYNTWLKQVSQLIKDEEFKFVYSDDCKNPNDEKVIYNIPGNNVFVLRSVILNDRWYSERWRQFEKQNFQEPFVAAVFKQIREVSVLYSTLKNKPRVRSEKTEEPTYWVLECSRFVPKYDPVENLDGVWFLGHSLKPVDPAVNNILRKHEADYNLSIKFTKKVYMIPKRCEKKATDNPNLENIIDAAKNVLLDEKNLGSMTTESIKQIFGSNYITYGIRNLAIIKDDILKNVLSKIPTTKSWAGTPNYVDSSGVCDLYKNIFGTSYSTPEIEYLKNKYSLFYKLHRLNYDEITEILNYMWSKK